MTVLELRNKLDERVRDGDGNACVCAAPADRRKPHWLEQ